MMAAPTLLKIVDVALKEFLNKVSQIQRIEDLSNVRNEFRKKVADGIVKEYNKNCKAKLATVKELTEEIVRACRSIGLDVLIIDAKLKSVGAIGLSHGILHGVFEIGLFWDHLLDVPFIPGSSIKGAIRSLMLANCINAKNRRKCVELTLKLLGSSPELSPEERIFVEKYLGVNLKGLNVEATSSHVRLLDAYPIECSKSGLLEEWIMTPHYKEDVADEYDASPTPLLHLVVAKGTVFRFIAALDGIAKEIASRYVEMIIGRKVDGVAAFTRIFIDALNEGIGARTSRGYNVFGIVKVLLCRSRPCR